MDDRPSDCSNDWLTCLCWSCADLRGFNAVQDWQDIETAPNDGSIVWVKRVYKGGIIKQGEAVFDVPHPDAPMLQPIGADPLGRLSAEDYAREDEQAKAAAVTKRWLIPDRMYAFPTPTHWRPKC